MERERGDGAAAYDASTVTASASGRAAPTGTVTYTLYGDSACTGTARASDTETIGASGAVPNSAPSGPLPAGGYGYRAAYSGDSVYAANPGACVSFSVKPKTSGASVAVYDANSGHPWSGREPAGARAYATATLSGVNANGITATGTVTYRLYSGGSCSGAAIGTDAEHLRSNGSVPNSAASTALGVGELQLLGELLGRRQLHRGDERLCEAFKVLGAPRVTIVSPASGGVYTIRQTIPTSFTCADGAGAPGIGSCRDSNDSASPGTLETTTLGRHTYTVTAISGDGQSATATIDYIVRRPSNMFTVVDLHALPGGVMKFGVLVRGQGRSTCSRRPGSARRPAPPTCRCSPLWLVSCMRGTPPPRPARARSCSRYRRTAAG